MIEAVGVVSTRSASQRGNISQAGSSASLTSEPIKAASPPNAMLYVRVNNSANRVILEARSNDGEVLRQYPSEYQIRAIQQASSLESKKAEAKQSPDQSEAKIPDSAISSSAPEGSTDVTVDSGAAAPSGGDVKTTQSVLV